MQAARWCLVRPLSTLTAFSLIFLKIVPMNLSSMGSAGMSDAGRQEVQNQIMASVHPDAAQARAYAEANPGQVGVTSSASGSGGAGSTMDLSPQVQNAGLYQSIDRI